MDKQTRFWINEIINYEEKELVKDKERLIEEYEIFLNKQSDFLNGYSPTVKISVSIGSVIQAAYNYTKINSINLQEYRTKLLNVTKFNNEIVNGKLNPRVFLYTDVLNGINKYLFEINDISVEKDVKIRYVIKLLIFIYHQKIFGE